MYTHARQFPHFAGMTDEQIVAVVRRAYAKHSRFIAVRRASIVGGVTVSIILLMAVGLRAAHAMEISAAIGAAIFLLWNLVFVNTSLFRLTSEEMQAG